jgi:hypothetical protein
VALGGISPWGPGSNAPLEFASESKAEEKKVIKQVAEFGSLQSNNSYG